MAKKITFYEPTMCCSSGVCGPNPDQALISLQDTIDKIKARGVEVERFQLTSHPRKFTENPEVMKLMRQDPLKSLPVTAVDGVIIKTRSYPTLEELLGHISS
jgi:hypothetical protein